MTVLKNSIIIHKLIITHFKIVNYVISLRLTRGIPLDMSTIQCNCTILFFEKKCYFTFKKLRRLNVSLLVYAILTNKVM